jgi:hypothetical protein
MKIDFEIPEHIFKEYLLWLLYLSEVKSGSFEVEGEFVSFQVEDQLKLEGEGDVRQTDLKKGVPSISEEAKTSFKNGKLPTKMKAKITVGEDNYIFTIDSKTMEIQTVKIPVVALKEPELKMDQRLFHISQIFRVLELLFVQFTKERLDADLWETRVKEINQWING